eukprot:TRINITY_DN6131_c0_g1_i1.p1 TRINITY_DN6131_c0_g1~~TRINITY_DN6131_c0_g1_i1.p1  ORF type:complete len:1348 (-),score=351.84 TRINITY_DN6131_c0_g1_i1:42-4085(-)
MKGIKDKMNAVGSLGTRVKDSLPFVGAGATTSESESAVIDVKIAPGSVDKRKSLFEQPPSPTRSSPASFIHTGSENSLFSKFGSPVQKNKLATSGDMASAPSSPSSSSPITSRLKKVPSLRSVEPKTPLKAGATNTSAPTTPTTTIAAPTFPTSTSPTTPSTTTNMASATTLATTSTTTAPQTEGSMRGSGGSGRSIMKLETSRWEALTSSPSPSVPNSRAPQTTRPVCNTLGTSPTRNALGTQAGMRKSLPDTSTSNTIQIAHGTKSGSSVTILDHSQQPTTNNNTVSAKRKKRFSLGSTDRDPSSHIDHFGSPSAAGDIERGGSALLMGPGGSGAGTGSKKRGKMFTSLMFGIREEKTPNADTSTKQVDNNKDNITNKAPSAMFVAPPSPDVLSSDRLCVDARPPTPGVPKLFRHNTSPLGGNHDSHGLNHVAKRKIDFGSISAGDKGAMLSTPTSPSSSGTGNVSEGDREQSKAEKKPEGSKLRLRETLTPSLFSSSKNVGEQQQQQNTPKKEGKAKKDGKVKKIKDLVKGGVSGGTSGEVGGASIGAPATVVSDLTSVFEQRQLEEKRKEEEIEADIEKKKQEAADRKREREIEAERERVEEEKRRSKEEKEREKKEKERLKEEREKLRGEEREKEKEKELQERCEKERLKEEEKLMKEKQREEERAEKERERGKEKEEKQRLKLEKHKKKEEAEREKEDIKQSQKKGMFEVNLDELMSLQANIYPELKVPKILAYMAEAIVEVGCKEEGLFRLSGNNSEIEKIKSRIEKRGLEAFATPLHLVPCKIEPNFNAKVHNITTLLKLWIRSLPEPVVPTSFYHKCLQSDDHPEQSVALAEVMPPTHRETLRYIITFLQKNVLPPEVQETTKMGVDNISLIFGACLLSYPGQSATDILMSTDRQNKFVYNLLTNWHAPEPSSSTNNASPKLVSRRNTTIPPINHATVTPRFGTAIAAGSESAFVTKGTQQTASTNGGSEITAGSNAGLNGNTSGSGAARINALRAMGRVISTDKPSQEVRTRYLETNNNNSTSNNNSTNNTAEVRGSPSMQSAAMLSTSPKTTTNTITAVLPSFPTKKPEKKVNPLSHSLPNVNSLGLDSNNDGDSENDTDNDDSDDDNCTTTLRGISPPAPFPVVELPTATSTSAHTPISTHGPTSTPTITTTNTDTDTATSTSLSLNTSPSNSTPTSPRTPPLSPSRSYTMSSSLPASLSSPSLTSAARPSSGFGSRTLAMSSPIYHSHSGGLTYYQHQQHANTGRQLPSTPTSPSSAGSLSPSGGGSSVSPPASARGTWSSRGARASAPLSPRARPLPSPPGSSQILMRQSSEGCLATVNPASGTETTLGALLQ